VGAPLTSEPQLAAAREVGATLVSVVASGQQVKEAEQEDDEALSLWESNVATAAGEEGGGEASQEATVGSKRKRDPDDPGSESPAGGAKVFESHAGGGKVFESSAGGGKVFPAVAATEGYEEGMVLIRQHPEGRRLKAQYIEDRVDSLHGQSVGFALMEFAYPDAKGGPKKYRYGDLKYDVKSGDLADPRPTGGGEPEGQAMGVGAGRAGAGGGVVPEVD